LLEIVGESLGEMRGKKIEIEGEERKR